MSRKEIRNLSPEQKHAIYLRAFAINLEDEGLRSPSYFRDKSQCLSFQDVSPAEMGFIKAMKLKRGYVEPNELSRRLHQLKPSDNFDLHEYNHRIMQWDRSPLQEESFVIRPPPPEWFWRQTDDIEDMRHQLGNCRTNELRQEVEDTWIEKRNIELSPLPDSHLLRNMGHSPCGTLFPRYLVKGLHELRTSANARGKGYYKDEYERAQIRRTETVRQWLKERPDSILASDPVSIYRTWPSELMSRIDTVDQDAMRCGSKRYMADLEETEKKMQTLVGFWRDCGLVTGQRTPLSSQGSSKEETNQKEPGGSDLTLQKPPITAEDVIDENTQRSISISTPDGSHDDTSHIEDSTPFSVHRSLTTSDLVAPNLEVPSYHYSPLIGPKESSHLSETQRKEPLSQPPTPGVDAKTAIPSSAWCGRLRPRKEAPRLFNSGIGKPQKVRKGNDWKTPRDARRPKAKCCIDHRSKPAPSNSSGSQLHSDTAGPQTVATSVGKHRRSARLQQSL